MDKDSNGMTPLEGALLMKDLDMIKLVVETGTDKNIVLNSTRFNKKLSPIDYAHEWVLDEIELYLLEKGAKYIIHQELNEN
jgi:ankyrin repeat protein